MFHLFLYCASGFYEIREGVRQDFDQNMTCKHLQHKLENAIKHTVHQLPAVPVPAVPAPAAAVLWLRLLFRLLL